ncbi:MAG: class I SAM-dependent methyltransferase [Pirellulaceae bacterium]|nr:class I SAM-dependent methyltransferase [Pirellulaceae bacterium]
MNTNPFDDLELAARYECWYSGPGRRASEMEKALLGKLLRSFKDAKSVLEIGCGSGHFTRWMRQLGYKVTGLDSSAAMLDQARALNGVEYVVGDALSLPFEECDFDVSALITTLEFIDDPKLAITEAARVAKIGLLLGAINRHSVLGLRRSRSRRTPWNSAKLYTPHELSCLVRSTLADRVLKISWQTTLWPIPFVKHLPHPWGDFIGLSVNLKPLARRSKADQTYYSSSQ